MGKRGPAPGQRFGGRQKGTPNRLSGDVKQMILAALDEKGGVAYLVAQADANPTAFLSLVGKVLPLTVQGDPDRPLSIQIVSGVPRAVEQPETQANGHAASH